MTGHSVLIVRLDPWWFYLFYLSQMVVGHTLFDYNVGLNEIVQLLIKLAAPAVIVGSSDENAETETSGVANSEEGTSTGVGVTCELYHLL